MTHWGLILARFTFVPRISAQTSIQKISPQPISQIRTTDSLPPFPPPLILPKAPTWNLRLAQALNLRTVSGYQVYTWFNHSAMAHTCYLDLGAHLCPLRTSSLGSRYLLHCCPDLFTNPTPWFPVVSPMLMIYLNSLDAGPCFPSLVEIPQLQAPTCSSLPFKDFPGLPGLGYLITPFLRSWTSASLPYPTARFFCPLFPQVPVWHLYFHSPSGIVL